MSGAATAWRGTSFSMLHTLNEACKVAQLQGLPFTSLDGFYLATLGGAPVATCRGSGPPTS